MRNCPTCHCSTAQHGIQFKAEATECMGCEGMRDQLERLCPELERDEITIEIRKASELFRLGEAARLTRSTNGTSSGTTSDVIGEGEHRQRLHDAVDLVDKAMGMSMAELCSTDRTKFKARARHVFFWLAREMGCGLAKIGQFVSKDHSTVLHGISRLKMLIRKNPDIAQLTTALLHGAQQRARARLDAALQETEK